MITAEMVPQLFGDEVLDRDGHKVGKVCQVYVDQGGQPVWATVKTGLFGTKETVIPLGRARVDGDALRLPISKDLVKEAPQIDTTARQMSPHDEQEIHRYYGQEYSTTTGQRQRPGEPQPDSMTLSEEHLKVGTEHVETGKVPLRKYVATEQQQVTVPGRHEEARVVREPITGTGRQPAGDAEIAEAEQEQTLHAEGPFVQKEVWPLEQVRLAKETVTDEQTVSSEVRRGQLEAQDETGALGNKHRHRDRRDRRDIGPSGTGGIGTSAR